MVGTTGGCQAPLKVCAATMSTSVVRLMWPTFEIATIFREGKNRCMPLCWSTRRCWVWRRESRTPARRRWAAPSAGAAGPVSAILPPGAEDASAAAAAAFVARGAETEAMLAQLTVVRALFARHDRHQRVSRTRRPTRSTRRRWRCKPAVREHAGCRHSGTPRRSRRRSTTP